jgi:hypothetical protein
MGGRVVSVGVVVTSVLVWRDHRKTLTQAEWDDEQARPMRLAEQVWCKLCHSHTHLRPRPSIGTTCASAGIQPLVSWTRTSKGPPIRAGGFLIDVLAPLFVVLRIFVDNPSLVLLKPIRTGPIGA